MSRRSVALAGALVVVHVVPTATCQSTHLPTFLTYRYVALGRALRLVCLWHHVTPDEPGPLTKPIYRTHPSLFRRPLRRGSLLLMIHRRSNPIENHPRSGMSFLVVTTAHKLNLATVAIWARALASTGEPRAIS